MPEGETCPGVCTPLPRQCGSGLTGMLGLGASAIQATLEIASGWRAPKRGEGGVGTGGCREGSLGLGAVAVQSVSAEGWGRRGQGAAVVESS